ncbi:AMP-binding protein [Nonomuraea salmonea]|uniref:AMP-binding protein n=1 Tax=Nonomuraea salmonea TaxID=46181 RepID=UPI002FE7481D
MTRQHTIGDLLRRSAARHPAKTAIVFGDLRQSYADLDLVVNRTANALAARGVGKGDRFAVFSHNNHAFVVTYFALARLGGDLRAGQLHAGGPRRWRTSLSIPGRPGCWPRRRCCRSPRRR